MALFRYPKARHTRRLTPGPFSNYRSYKRFLEQEFFGKCIYCLKPALLPTSDGRFVVEHYLPRKFFPELENSYSNLYYSCAECNSYKGAFYPSEEDVSELRFVPNPCEHVMFEHLRYSSTTIVPKSRAGLFTIELLHLNDENFVQYRDTVHLACKAAAETVVDTLRTLQKLEATIRKCNSQLEKRRLLSQRHTLEQNLEKVKRISERLNA